MDGERFDTLARILSRSRSRRGIVGLWLGGTLGILGHIPTVAKKRKKKKKKKATPICVPNCTGKLCGDNGCGGSCGDCSGGKSCDGVSCVCPADQLDSGGVCAVPPGCLGQGALCNNSDLCCSAFCAGLLACTGSTAGQRCNVTSDCQSGLRCVGFVCTA